MITLSTPSLAPEYQQTVDFLYSLERFGILLGLDNIAALLKKLGNPHRTFPVAHVAGSNGKGSTASFITGIALAAGLKTALYTSPHLNDFRERIRIDGMMVSQEAVIESTDRIRALYDPTRTTFFEFTTALAFDCIAKAKPDLAVIEVGLGGRLDATNTVEPAVTVITDISREHEDYLGHGIASVAREKAGVIKAHVPLVSGAVRHEARQVILDVARELEAPIKEFGRDFQGRRMQGNTFAYRSHTLTLESLALTMPGSHQMKNASVAIAAVEELMAQGYTITEAAMREGIEATRFAGRFEIIGRDPDIIIDGAHTPEGMRLLKSTVKRLYPGVKPLVLLGMLKDKNYRKLAEIIVPLAREVICVPPLGDRALDPTELAAFVRELGVPAEAFPEIIEGFMRLMEKATKTDLILATGSLYMIGLVRRACGVAEE